MSLLKNKLAGSSSFQDYFKHIISDFTNQNMPVFFNSQSSNVTRHINGNLTIVNNVELLKHFNLIYSEIYPAL